MSSVTSESFKLGELQFREEHLPYRNSFDISHYETCILYAAPCGGALAFLNNLHFHIKASLNKNKLDFLTAYGDRIICKEVSHWNNVKKVGWTLSEHFVLMYSGMSDMFSETESSKVEILTVNQEFFKSFYIPGVCFF